MTLSMLSILRPRAISGWDPELMGYLVWCLSWFIRLILGFVTITGFLITRIIVKDRRLRLSNEELRQTMDERAEMEGVGYDKRIQIRTRAENDAVVIEVEDNGVGMDEATRQRLFEPFFTTKDADRGTGLGLSIIYAIVRNHDGEIAVESEQDVGTTFKVMLPVVERDLPAA